MPSRSLVEALDVPRDARVVAIGGGGKMEVLTVLGTDWAQSGGRPLLAPLAPIHDHESRGVPGVRTVVLPVARVGWPPISFLGGEMLVVGRKTERADTVDALLPEEIDQLIRDTGADLILLKGDDAQGRSLIEHEPSDPTLPHETALVIAVVGLDAWGAPLGEDTVHRPELFGERRAMVPGQRLEDDVFYAALSDPGGYRSLLPPGARYAVFLNKVDRPVRTAVAQRLAAGLIERGVNEVLWGDAREHEWTIVKRGVRT